jgi:hypothetical protein
MHVQVGPKTCDTALLFLNVMLRASCTTLLALGSLFATHIRAIRVRLCSCPTDFPRFLQYVPGSEAFAIWWGHLVYFSLISVRAPRCHPPRHNCFHLAITGRQVSVLALETADHGRSATNGPEPVAGHFTFCSNGITRRVKLFSDGVFPAHNVSTQSWPHITKMFIRFISLLPILNFYGTDKNRLFLPQYSCQWKMGYPF